MRICAHSKILKIFALPIHKQKQRGNIQIDYKTEIGYGLYIAHNGPVVINSTAKIGNNCDLSQGVTIGSNTGNAAKIDKNVYIGPNVCIVENVTISDNATIGAGVQLQKPFPKMQLQLVIMPKY